MRKENGKKGFTLIELLAVIAILAILVVLAVPSVLKLFNQGKESAFITQVNSVYSAAQTQYVADQLDNDAKTEYCTTGGNLIDLDASANLKYYVKFNAEGAVTAIKVADGVNYMEVLSGTISKSSFVEDLVKSGNATITCNTSSNNPASTPE